MMPHPEYYYCTDGDMLQKNELTEGTVTMGGPEYPSGLQVIITYYH